MRALGLAVGGNVQVSMNLIDPLDAWVPPTCYDLVGGRAAIERAELVGLVPHSVLERIEPSRWAQLDLDPDRTIEQRGWSRGITIV